VTWDAHEVMKERFNAAPFFIERRWCFVKAAMVKSELVFMVECGGLTGSACLT
jgi:hypothetical protein